MVVQPVSPPLKMIQPPRNPKKPKIIIIRPINVIGKLCGAIVCATPLINLPTRGPKLISTPKVKKPATACTTPDAPTS